MKPQPLTLAPLVALLLLAFLPAGCHREPAEEVVVYCSVDQEVSEPILKDFEKETGLKVLARYDTEAAKTVGLVQRLRAEKDRPVADVFWSGEPFHTVRLAKEGLLEACKPMISAGGVGASSDTGRFYDGFALRARAIGYHTGRVKADEAPAKIEDLLDPKWKGRIVMASPEAGTTSAHVAALFVLYGKDGAERILQGLKANEVRLVGGNSVAVRMVATGQADVCLTDTDDVYAGQRNQWPVAMNLCGHGDRGVLVIANTVALVKGGPHPQAARRLFGYLRSAAVERKMAESDAHNTPVDPKVARDFPAYAIPNRLAIDYDRVADAIPDAIAAASKILH